jgi:ATP-dependent DNA helicase RecG
MAALINAIIHRDYAILGSDIKMAIYDDMLEITSPGPLPDSLPVEELGSGRSEILHRVLAPVFKDLKLIEAWGSGIRKIHDELSDYLEIELVLQEVGQTFLVQFVKKDNNLQPESGQG